ncbi:conjugative transposon protein TraM [Flavobacterium sp.]|uniref:conjugative transposon protein TraM n=1 Tax=Flavobacterium sp. TaxID=239 RepID=UPI002BBA06AE|nr:conjugative transposon protein TraM [Flavobacterium sp.]HSD06372.1 conjugative transposon protein TraM [Flavobacterium sp.]
MKENDNQKKVVRVTEGNPKEADDLLLESKLNKSQKLKKSLIFGLMGVVFIGCMYLIFNPSSDKKEIDKIGLNDNVPQATDAAMPADKGKAYEQEMMERKNQEKQNALTSLSDYWNTDEKSELGEELPEEEKGNEVGNGTGKNRNPALNSYHNAQSTLGFFYKDDNSETQILRKQLEELKEKLAEKDVAEKVTVDDQLALMEKSYQMAAKYLPSNVKTGETAPTSGAVSASLSSREKEQFTAFISARKNAVSALYRESSDSVFLADWSQKKNSRFYTAGALEQVVQPRNSIKACVMETKTIIGDGGVRLRLLEPAKTPNHTIPKGTVLTANAKLEGGRLQLKVSSIEIEGNIISVDISIYDLDGQQGLYVPSSPEMNALTEMAGNMSQQTGTSLMLTQSAGQQVAADLSRGVIQGVSGYFSKKVKTPKVTVKAGYQLFLVSKK